MSTAKKVENPRNTSAAKCDNHPNRNAVHVTGTELHQEISLCATCLQVTPHLKSR